jgi:hypothetical protein
MLDDSKNPFRWVPVTIRYPEQKILESPGGVDSVLYLRWSKYQAIFFAVLAVIGCGLLIPINAVTGDEGQAGIQAWSLSNISSGSNWMWAHFACVFLFSAFGWWLMYRLYNDYVAVENSVRAVSDIQARTIMVKHIPARITNDAELAAFYRTWYPGVIGAKLMRRIPDLEALRRERGKLLQKHAAAVSKFEKTGKRPRIRAIKDKSICGCIGKKKDEIKFWQRKVAEIDEQLALAQLGAEQKFLSKGVGFVTFSNECTAMQAAQVQSYDRSWLMRADRAPKRSGVSWKFVAAAPSSLAIRAAIVYPIIVLVMLFWTIPVTFISGFSSVDSLSGGPLAKAIPSSSVARGLTVGFVPALLLTLIIQLLPIIFRALLSNVGYIDKRTIDVNLLRVYWTWLLINFFLLSAIAGSLIAVISLGFNDIGRLLLLLATSLPKQAILFTQFIITQTAILLVLMRLIRLIDALKTGIKRCFAKTHLQKLRSVTLAPYNFAVMYCKDAIVFTIAITYSAMAPVVLPFAAGYFALTWLIAKHNFTFAVAPPTHGELRLISQLINRLAVGLILFQLVTFAVLSSNTFFYAFILLALAAATIIYTCVLHNRYRRATVVYPMAVLPPLDVTTQPVVAEEVNYVYIQPALMPVVYMETVDHRMGRGMTWEEMLEDAYPEEELGVVSRYDDDVETGYRRTSVLAHHGSAYTVSNNGPTWMRGIGDGQMNAVQPQFRSHSIPNVQHPDGNHAMTAETLDTPLGIDVVIGADGRPPAFGVTHYEFKGDEKTLPVPPKRVPASA